MGLDWRPDEFGVVHEFVDGRRTYNRREITGFEEQLVRQTAELEAEVERLKAENQHLRSGNPWLVCDEPGCASNALNGFPTESGYRWLCDEHYKEVTE